MDHGKISGARLCEPQQFHNSKRYRFHVAAAVTHPRSVSQSIARPKLDFTAPLFKSANVFARCRKILVVLALVLTTGAHWAALQTVAWTTMLAANISQESFTAAVCQTFDGEHPCALCQAISTGKKAEQKTAFTAATLKLEFPPLAKSFILISPAPVRFFSPAKISAASFLPLPSVPPPRSRLA